MNVKVFVSNPFLENTYVLSHPETREALIVDPGMMTDAEWQHIRDYLTEQQLHVVRILVTHCHIDHMMGTGYLTEWCDAPVCGPVDDQLRLPSAERQFQLFGLSCLHPLTGIGRNLNEGDRFSFGSSEVQVLDVPGHSFHGLCYYFPNEKMLFSGDVLFYCSIGRSDFGPGMGCDGEALVDGIRTKLFALPPETRVYTGHGPATTIGQEIACNPYI